jgi:RHS repeat-associated protein
VLTLNGHSAADTFQGQAGEALTLTFVNVPVTGEYALLLNPDDCCVADPRSVLLRLQPPRAADTVTLPGPSQPGVYRVYLIDENPPEGLPGETWLGTARAVSAQVIIPAPSPATLTLNGVGDPESAVVRASHTVTFVVTGAQPGDWIEIQPLGVGKFDDPTTVSVPPGDSAVPWAVPDGADGRNRFHAQLRSAQARRAWGPFVRLAAYPVYLRPTPEPIPDTYPLAIELAQEVDGPMAVTADNLVRITVNAEAHEDGDELRLVPVGAPNGTPSVVPADVIRRAPDEVTPAGAVYHTYWRIPAGGPWEARFLSATGGILLNRSGAITVRPQPRLTINGVGVGTVTVAAGTALSVVVEGPGLSRTDRVLVAGANGTTAWTLSGGTQPLFQAPSAAQFTAFAPATVGTYQTQLELWITQGAAWIGPITGPTLAVTSTGPCCQTTETGPDERFFFDLDAVGSVRQIVQSPPPATGPSVWRKDYQPFGLETGGNAGTTGGKADDVQFAGKEFDADSGLNYSGARYYASMTGRFTTVDPGHVGGDVMDPQSWNGYAYALNNPFRFVAPEGSCSQDAKGNYVDGDEGGTMVAAGACPRGKDGALVIGISETVSVKPSPSNTAQSTRAPFLDGLLLRASNFSAGMGDAPTGRMIPGVNTSLTEYVRNQMDTDDVVAKSSSSDGVGEFAGGTVGWSLAASVSATAAAIADGKRGALFGRGTQTVFNSSKIRFGWNWEGTGTGGRDVIRLGIGEARGTNWWSHIRFWYP